MRSKQIFYITLGVLLYTLVSNYVLLLHLPPIRANELLWIAPTLVVPIAFGVLYGFWAGLVLGGLGYFLGSYISIVIRSSAVSSSSLGLLTLSTLHLPWYFHLGFLAIGAIAGLATILTKGRYRSIRNIAIAESFGLIGILGGFLIAFNGLWSHIYQGESLWIDFTHIALPNMVLVVILLPLVLTTRNLFEKHK